MAYIVTPPKSNFDTIPDGTYGARLYGIGHLGDQEFTYNGTTKILEKVLFTFELDYYLADGRPVSLSKDFTFTFYDQGNLLPAIEALLQRNPNIKAVSRLARGVALPPKTNMPWFWWLTEDGFD